MGDLAVALAASLLLASAGVVPVGYASSPAEVASGFTFDTLGAPVQPSVAAPSGDKRQFEAASTPVVPQANTTGYLALPSSDIRTEGLGTVGVEVSSALAADADRLNEAFAWRQLRAAYAAAETDAERRLTLSLAAERVATRVTRLRRQEDTALEKLNAGQYSRAEYLRELAVIDARADGLLKVIQHLERRATRMDDPPVTRGRLAGLEAQLLPLRGPVRDRVGQVLAGKHGDSLRVYVETSSTGAALAMITETDGEVQYVREVYRRSARNPNAENRFDGNLEGVLGRFSELYPWARNHTAGSIGIGHLEHSSVYSVTFPHAHGQLTAYLDGGTNDVFMEYQHKRLARIPTETPVTNASDGLRLQVNRTRVGGPLEVRVVDADTGEPVDARITVKDHLVGRTGADGRLWTIGPPVRFAVIATTDGRRVSVHTFSRRNAG